MFWMNVGIIWIILQLVSNRFLYIQSRRGKDTVKSVIIGSIIGIGIEVFIIVHLFRVVNQV